MEKRIKILCVTLLVAAGLLILRTAYIQVLGHEELSAAARMQQEITLEGADTRGVIYDRNGTPIAGGNQEYIYVIKEGNYDGETQNALNKLYAKEIPNENNEYRVFSSEIYSKSTGERLIRNSEAYILEVDRRYKENQPAVHMVGYINPSDNSGVSGLECLYDKELGAYEKKVAAVADVKGTLLQGYGLNVSSSAENDSYIREGITTTLELGLQKKVEDVLALCEYDGSITVIKAETGEIMAAASTPVFDPDEIGKYLDSNNGELINKITQGTYPPGSVFKIVVAAAALEEGIEPDRFFECTGREIVNGNVVKCSTGGESGHGRITFEQAFADSCNCVFIKLGQLTGADAVLEMAERMGFGKLVLENFPQEKEGNLMSVRDSEGAAIANLSIGQGSLLVTPLQVAQMTAIVANDGIATGVRLTEEDEMKEVRCISKDTAGLLRQMMRSAVEYGTGSSLGLSVAAGVKTGSAESAQNGQNVVHGWITGYLPAEDPEYIITVFTEGGKSGRGSAGPLFAQVAEYITKSDMLESELGF